MKQITASPADLAIKRYRRVHREAPEWAAQPNGDVITQSEIAALREASLLNARLGENVARRLELGATIERGALTIGEVSEDGKPGHRVPVRGFARCVGEGPSGRVYAELREPR